jgi:hypothetical protein
MGVEMVRWARVGLVVVAACFPGCGGKDDRSQSAEDSAGGASSGETLARGELSTQVAEILCKSFAPCCAGTNVVFDPEACEGFVSTWVGAALDLDSAKVSYDGQAAADCLEESRRLTSCDDLAEMVRLERSADRFAVPDALPASCRRALSGKVPLGEPCESSLECMKPEEGVDVTCSFADGKGHVCTPYRRPGEGVVVGALGDACDETCPSLDYCFDNGESGESVACLYADGLGCVDGTCQPLPKAGEECLFGFPCANGSYCADQQNQCISKLEDGEKCSSLEECLSGGCANHVCGERDLIAYACEKLP